MQKELTTVNDDIGFEVSDIMLIFMMVIVASLMTTVVAPVTQQLQAQAYRGLTDSRTLNATPTLQWVNLLSDPPYNPWISASFFNDGPNSVFIAINNPAELAEIASSESLEVNMAGGQRRIEFVFYKCNIGGKASIRAIGKY